MNYKKPLFGTLIVSAVVSMAFIGMSLAQNVTVSEDTTIKLANGAEFIILSSSNALDQVEVNTEGTNFTITTALTTGFVKIKNLNGVNMGKKTDGTYYNGSNLALTSCDSNGSVLTINANATSAVTVVVTPPANNAGCDSTSTGVTAVTYSGGGSGGSSGGASTGGSGQTQTQTQTQTQAKIQPRVDALEKIMTENKTLKFKLNPKSTLANAVVARIILALAGEECDDSDQPSNASCLKKAKDKGFLEANAVANTSVQRYQYYLKIAGALGLQADITPDEDLTKYIKTECNVNVAAITKKLKADLADAKKNAEKVKKAADKKNATKKIKEIAKRAAEKEAIAETALETKIAETLEIARAFKVAKDNGFAKQSGNKCGLTGRLNVGEAAEIAVNAKSAKK